MRLDSYWFSKGQGPVDGLLESFLLGQQVTTESYKPLRVIKDDETLQEVIVVVDLNCLEELGLQAVEPELARDIKDVLLGVKAHAIGSCYSLVTATRFLRNKAPNM